MSFQSFLNEIDRVLPDPVYLLYASDPFLNKEAIYEITKLVPDDEREFNLHIFDLTFTGEENPSFEHVLNVANTISFFGSRRFTVLAVNLQKLPKRDLERLKNYVSNPAPNAVFVILHEGGIKKEIKEGLKNLKSISLDIRESEIKAWIRQKSRAKGIEISDGASDYLLGLTGNDLGLLSAEIEKISLLGKERIDVDDISDIITGGKYYNIFDLTKALMRKDADTVFRIYKTLKSSAEDYSLIGVLNWQYGHNLYSGHRPKSDNYFLKAFELLNRVDIDIKSSGRNFPLEYLLIKLLRLEG
ncbi:MAG: DNA polymerase III subunit delta [Nitrospirae bacterium]|jgi:DNA polymerase III subunit delta|nr:DNA polymerase III subunit delta [Nitrospirota bacterium]